VRKTAEQIADSILSKLAANIPYAPEQPAPRSGMDRAGGALTGGLLGGVGGTIGGAATGYHMPVSDM
jgi:predicted lipid-binding transport protein (Tim44 family)